MTDKRTIVSALLVLGVTFLIVHEYYFTRPQQEDYNKRAIEETLEKYELVKKTELTRELRYRTLGIVKDRKNCFSTQITYSERNNTCKREYTYQIVQLAREKIRSAPMRGLFIRCIRECPIAGSLCSGEDGTSEQQCIQMEAQCIEYCLDEFWRGGNIIFGDTYTHKNKKRK